MKDKKAISISIHLNDIRLANIHSLDWDRRDLLADDQTSDALTLPSCSSPPEGIFTLFFNALVRFDKVTQHLSASCSDDTCIDVRTRTEIVEDTS